MIPYPASRCNAPAAGIKLPQSLGQLQERAQLAFAADTWYSGCVLNRVEKQMKETGVQKVVLTAVLICAGAGGPRADEVTVPARRLSDQSQNIAAEYPQFGNLTLCVGRGGFMEWAFEVEGGRYWLHFRYCSGEPRPCTMTVNGKQWPGQVLTETTGGFMPSHLGWATYGPVELAKGTTRIRLATDGFMPHFKGLCVSRHARPPQRMVFAPGPDELADVLGRLNLPGLRKAIEYLARKYPAEYPGADEYLARLEQLENSAQGRLEPGTLDALSRRARALAQEALVRANPLLKCGKLLFVKRYTYQSSHYYTEFIDGCLHFGGNLCVLSLDDGSVTELVPQLREGIFGRYDLSFDATRIVFGYKARPGEGFRIWEVGVDGKGLRQVTYPPPDEQQRIEKYWQRDSAFLAKRKADYRHHTDDMHPCYLPDGGYCFISTRCERGILCDGPDVLTTTTLYRTDRDGRNMEVLSDSPVSEASPSVMNDGRILYTRWEYVDKADVVIKCLWAMRPDGTGSAEIFGNDITFPDTMLHGRAVPGFNNLFAVIGAPHMPMGVGTVLRLDINYPIRTREPMTYITPDVDVRTEFGFFHKRRGKWVRDTAGPLYTDVQPLDEKFFLVSCNPDRDCHDLSAYGLYLIDEFGNRVLIHNEPDISCWQPMPLQKRPRPPVLPSLRSDPGRGAESATVVMQDVYAGLQGVPRGTIRYLRIMETVPRPWAARRFWDGDSAYQQHAVVSMNTHLHVKRLHGIVRVEPDGSACFKVPPDKNLFFQALDENFMEVQRMRTFVNFRPGEKRSCIGCHEMRRLAPTPRQVQALRRGIQQPFAQPGETAPRAIYYPTDVQPIWDRHCVRCHNAQDKAGDLDLSGELTTLFNRSYENILRKDLIKVWRENQPKTGDASPIPPYTLGSHASKLIRLIRNGHENVKLSREEFIALVTWVDANGPYYGSYFGRRNIKYKDHPDFRPVPLGGRSH